MWNGLVTEELRDLSLQYANKFRGACPDEYEDIDYDDITILNFNPAKRAPNHRLPDAQAARNEKRGHMAYCRVACRARCAAAFDALRRHAAVERQPAQLQPFLPRFLHQHSV